MKKTAQNLNRIDNTPLAIIVTLLMIYWEVLPSMIDVGLITPCELFKTLCTGMEVAEFNYTLFKASGKTFMFIQTVFNEKIYIATDKSSDEVKDWKQKKGNRNMERKGYPITA